MADAATAVKVAEDVLKWLAVPEGRRAAVMKQGAYVEGYLTDLSAEALDGELAGSLGKILDCQVCMLGACLVAKSRLFGGVRLGSLPHSEDLADLEFNFWAASDHVEAGLAEVFDPVTLAAMESAFEQSDMGGGDTEVNYGAAIFGERYEDDTERARAIMRNVIDHGGRFVVEPVAHDVFWTAGRKPGTTETETE